jgi:hypothetical protein
MIERCATKVGPYPIAISQYSAATSYQVSYHIQSLCFESDGRLYPHKAERFVFTASTKEHATRCLARVLGDAALVDTLFAGLIDTRTCGLATKVRKTPSWPRSWANFNFLSLYPRGNTWANLHRLGQPNTLLATKHAPASFEAAMAAAGVPRDPATGAFAAAAVAGCVLLDDSVRNIQRAKAMGWRTVLVGKVERDSGAALASLDEGLLSFSLSILLYMVNPYSYKKCQ